MAAASARQPAASGEDNGKGLAGGAEMAFRFNTVLFVEVSHTVFRNHSFSRCYLP